MITEKELTEYRSLCYSLAFLREKFRKKRQELRLILLEAAARRQEALLFLAKANRLTLRLNGCQRQIAGLPYHLSEIIKRIHNTKQVLFQVGVEMSPDEIQGDCLDRRELKQKVLLILTMIDDVKKKLLQLDLMELRCRELLLSLGKAMEAFRHEWRGIRRKIYPYGIISRFCRFLNSLLGKAYFSFRDLEEIAALGNITGLVLKIADSPLI
jgi:hypothetical protein